MVFFVNSPILFAAPVGNTVDLESFSYPVPLGYNLQFFTFGSSLPQLSDILFSDPTGTDLNNTAAVFVDFSAGNISANSPTVDFAATSYPTSGVYTANFQSEDFTYDADTTAASAHNRVIVPTVTLDGSGIVQSVSWSYKDPETGAAEALDFTLDDLQFRIFRFTAEGFQENFLSGASIDVSAEGIPWDDVSGLDIQYQDDKDLVYNSSYGTQNVAPTPQSSMTMLFLTEGMMEDSSGPAISAVPFAVEMDDSFSDGILSYFLAFDLEVFPVPPTDISAEEVTFTSPVNSHFNGEISDFAIVQGPGIFAQSQPVPLDGTDRNGNYPDPDSANNGDYTAAYMGVDHTTQFDPNFTFLNHYTVNPTVNVSGGDITTISWTYLSPADSAELNQTGLELNVTISDMVINLNLFSGNDFEQRNLTSASIDVTMEGIPWTEVESIDIAYVDDRGIVYLSHYATQNVAASEPDAVLFI